MRTPLTAAVAALALAVPAAASAQAPFLGLRIGYALPFGDVASGRSMRDVVKSDVPIQIDGGFRLDPWTLAGYLSYGFGQLASEADRACGTADCSANVFRLGLQAALHSEIRPEREVWGGVFGGYERLDLDAPGSLDLTASGWELGLQGGFDFATRSTGFGPFAAFSFGRFTSLAVGGNDVDVPEATHVTLQLGIRGYFKL
jgi:hypothetical protein